MVIDLTNEAIEKLLEKTSDNKNIRIGVKSSGCNGFKYLFDYLKDDPKEDYVIVCKNQTCSNKIKSLDELKSVEKNYAV